MKIEKVNVYDLKNYEKNNRIHSPKQIQEIQKSITDFGFIQPCVIDKDNVLVIGHGRAEAYKKLVELGTQPKEIDCVRIDNLTPKQIRKLRLLDNKLNDMGERNIENIKVELEEIDDPELNELFIDMEELELETPEAKEDNYEAPAEITTDIKRGDLITFEKDGQILHKLLCGDSCDENDVKKLIGDNKIDCVFTDPPYGISIVGKQSNKEGGGLPTKFGKVGGGNYVNAKTYSHIVGDETTDTAKKFYELSKKLGFENYIIRGGNYFTDFLSPSMCWIVRDKQNTGNFADVELARTSYNKSAKLYSYLRNGMSREGSRELEGKTRVHPTQKPVGLFINIFNDFDFKTIYDGFLGSGSVMVAGHKTDKKVYGIEISEQYCEVIKQRMQKLDPTLTIKKNGVEIK